MFFRIKIIASPIETTRGSFPTNYSYKYKVSYTESVSEMSVVHIFKAFGVVIVFIVNYKGG